MIDHAGFTCSLHVFTFAQNWKKKKTVLETYLKYRMIVYTCQVETDTKKKEESEIKLIYYILILLLEFPLK